MSDLVNLVVCVDDTDDVTKTTSTGAVAECLAQVVLEYGGLLDLGISRHQLLLDDRVNYTSHNSAMAFSARIVADTLDEIYALFIKTIDTMKADTANPGLCLAVTPHDDVNEKASIASLVNFGFKAKKQVLSSDDAHRLASSIPWVALTEHGGTGEGVIGALAGVGLRMAGCDGRFRGKWDLAALCNVSDSAGSVAMLPVQTMQRALCEQLQSSVVFISTQGERLKPSTPVAAVHDAKPILRGNALTLMTNMRDGIAWPCNKNQLDEVVNSAPAEHASCSFFEQDNDDEELMGVCAHTKTCANCLYRRWTTHGFTCMKKEA